jgi:uncharacterized protein (TIGR02001 family)
MIKSRIAVAGALLAVAGAANAGFTVTPTITSDYDFRGVTQTDTDPAFQLGSTYTHESGFYIGAWGSNVDFGPGNPDLEIDVFTGFAGGDATETFGYDIGANYYTYPNAGTLNSVEIYAGISKGYFSGKVWYSPDIASTKDSGTYLEGNVAFPLPEGFSLLGHVGHTFGKATLSGYKATDYSAGVAKAFGNISVSVKYVDGSEDAFDSRVIASITTTLPWASE